MALSSFDGWQSPLGWLWATRILAQFARIATLKTSRGATMDAVSEPMLTVWSPMAQFFWSNSITTKCSLSTPSKYSWSTVYALAELLIRDSYVGIFPSRTRVTR